MPFRVGQALTGATDPPAAHSTEMKMWVYFESVRTPKKSKIPSKYFRVPIKRVTEVKIKIL